MRILHPWNVNPEDAARLQEQLREKVVLNPPKGPFDTVAGVFAAMREGEPDAAAAALVMHLPDFHVLESKVASATIPMPYVPGLLAFTVGPALVTALEMLEALPSVAIINGHGLAHPRRFGLASHIGVLLDIPTVGCAEEALCGEFDEPGPRRGDAEVIWLDGEPVGMAVRVRSGVGPLFVSPGHRMDIPTAVSIALSAVRRFRTPEPLRRARALARRMYAAR